MNRAMKLLSVLSFVAIIGTLFYVQLVDSPSERLTLKDQVAVHSDKSFKEINEMAKYDRPDMGVMQNFEMP